MVLKMTIKTVLISAALVSGLFMSAANADEMGKAMLIATCEGRIPLDGSVTWRVYAPSGSAQPVDHRVPTAVIELPPGNYRFEAVKNGLKSISRDATIMANHQQQIVVDVCK